MLNFLRRNKTQPVKNKATLQDYIMYFFGGSPTNSEIAVNPTNAMQITAVYACVSLISESVANLPLILYQDTNIGRERAKQHELYKILRRKANNFQSSQSFIEQMTGLASLRGNAYAKIQRNRRGQVTQLIPLNPERVRVEAVDVNSLGLRLVYTFYHPNGEEIKILDKDMFHIKGFSRDGITGIDMITQHAETMGISLSTQAHTARAYSNGVTPSGVLQIPNSMSDESFQRFKQTWTEGYTGSKNAGKPMILEDGATWQQMGMTNEQSQFIETQQFQVNDICRIFKVPPHKIAELTKSSFSNITEQNQEFIDFTLRTWLNRWENEIYIKLLDESEQADFYAEFLVDSLLRGNPKDRWESYKIAILNGVMSPNEVRQRENLNKVDGLDIYLTPMNQLPVAGADKSQALEGIQDKITDSQSGDNNA